MSLKILLVGAKGRMGVAIKSIAEANNTTIAGEWEKDDELSLFKAGNYEAVIDFSFHEVTSNVAQLAATNRWPLVIGTTGHTDEERTNILQEVDGKIPVIWAGNYSIGVNTLNHLTRKAAAILGKKYDPEVMEMHHRHKKDAPSGTAERLIQILCEEYGYEKNHVIHGRKGLIGARSDKEIGSHAIRGGDIVGEHTVYFCGEGERIELTHRATDRGIFAQGALRAAHWAVGKAPGIYNMEQVLGFIDS